MLGLLWHEFHDTIKEVMETGYSVTGSFYWYYLRQLIIVSMP